MVNKKWIAALRSGKFRQTRGILHNTKGNGGYCCLGVGLCVLYPKIPFTEIATKRNGSKWSMPTASNCEKLGITKSIAINLADLNDDAKWNFKKIADFLVGKIDKNGKSIK